MENTDSTKILDFPELLQTDIWDCGASALQGVLLYYGIKVLTSDLIRLLKTNENDGTSLQSIKDTLETYRLKYNGQEMTTTILKEYIDLKIPVMLLLQAWAEN